MNFDFTKPEISLKKIVALFLAAIICVGQMNVFVAAADFDDGTDYQGDVSGDVSGDSSGNSSGNISWNVWVNPDVDMMDGIYFIPVTVGDIIKLKVGAEFYRLDDGKETILDESEAGIDVSYIWNDNVDWNSSSLELVVTADNMEIPYVCTIKATLPNGHIMKKDVTFILDEEVSEDVKGNVQSSVSGSVSGDASSGWYYVAQNRSITLSAEVSELEKYNGSSWENASNDNLCFKWFKVISELDGRSDFLSNITSQSYKIESVGQNDFGTYYCKVYYVENGTEDYIGSAWFTVCEMEAIPCEEHIWDYGKVTTEATCVKDGVKTYTCTVCGETKTEVIPATGVHSYDSGKITTAATCVKAGVKTYTCTVCGATKTESIAATGVHSYGAWTTTKAATVLAQGEETRTCSVCGAKETRAIAKKAATISVNYKTIPLAVKQSTTAVKVSYTKGDGIASWKSSNKKVATVTSKGKITGKKKGTATITVTLKSGKQAKITVKVQKKAVATTKVAVNSKSVKLKKGKKFQLKTTVTPVTSKQKVTYKTSNKKIATVTSKGKITAKKKGKATITVKSGKKSVKVKVTVK